MTTILNVQPGGKTPAAASVINVDERSFEQEVIARSQHVPVVVDFWAPWCGPCRTLGPMLERLAGEAKGTWVLAKVNVDENQRLAQMFRVQGIPAVKAVRNAKLVDEFTGALPESQIRAWLKRVVGAAADPAADALAAIRALEADNPREAAARYRVVLGDEPENAAVLFALGRLLLTQGDTEGAETLRQVPADSPFFARAQALLPLTEFFAQPAAAPASASDSEARYHHAAALYRKGDSEGALATLLAIVARDRAFHDDGARKAMLGIFAALDDDNPVVAQYRRKLANTLF